MTKSTRNLKKKERQARVAALIIAGASSVRDIARKVGCAHTTARRDCAELEELWGAEMRPEDRHAYIIRELKKCEHHEMTTISKMQPRRNEVTGETEPAEIEYLRGLQVLAQTVWARRDRLMGIVDREEALAALILNLDLSRLTDEQLLALTAGKRLDRVLAAPTSTG